MTGPKTNAHRATEPILGLGGGRAAAQPSEVMVGLAEVCVMRAPVNFAFIGIGSCVGLVALDPVANIAGAVHVMLPRSIQGMAMGQPGKFADTAPTELVRQMVEAGAIKDRIVAAYAGGASVGIANASAGYDIGSRNIDSLKEALEKLGLPIVASDEGGTTGRTVRLVSATGEVTVRTITQGEALLCTLREA